MQRTGEDGIDARCAMRDARCATPHLRQRRPRRRARRPPTGPRSTIPSSAACRRPRARHHASPSVPLCETWPVPPCPLPCFPPPPSLLASKKDGRAFASKRRPATRADRHLLNARSRRPGFPRFAPRLGRGGAGTAGREMRFDDWPAHALSTSRPGHRTCNVTLYSPL